MANVDLSSRLTLPDNPEALRVLAQTLLQEREQYQQQLEEQRQRAEQQKLVAEERSRQTTQLQAEILRLQVELERYKKWYYGPRADRLRTPGELAQLLLQFAEE
ncbi:MAG: hypothetical protein JOZ45_03890, partial [Acidobacteriaceae bacterium]|nr:hypothetical protein [Acidobacteriaceae bacterium]